MTTPTADMARNVDAVASGIDRSNLLISLAVGVVAVSSAAEVSSLYVFEVCGVIEDLRRPSL